jgi:hypothetical protein
VFFGYICKIKPIDMNFKLLLLFFGAFFMSNFFAQLTVDAGPMQVACKNWSGVSKLSLGGSPAISSGTPPYICSWSATYELTIGSTTFSYTASDFLLDTSVPNPTLVQFPIEDELYFFVTVTDADGNSATDSVLIKPSLFVSHLGQYYYNVAIGDSIFYNAGPNIAGGIEPYQEVIWRPNEGLVDSTVLNGFWIKPESSQNYYVTITDSAGCEISGGIFVFVSVGVAEMDYFENTNWVVYPNPSNTNFTIAHAESIREVQLFDLQGKYLKTCSSFPCSIDDLSAGTYELLIYPKNGQALSKKLVVE